MDVKEIEQLKSLMDASECDSRMMMIGDYLFGDDGKVYYSETDEEVLDQAEIEIARGMAEDFLKAVS